MRAAQRAEPHTKTLTRNFTATFILWIAQGFGAGRIPWAPGTFGSLVGVLWTLTLVQSGSLWLYLAGVAAGLLVCVPICSRAESLLNEKDASSIVLDEIAVMPICFLPWAAAEWSRHGRLPAVESFFQQPYLYGTMAILAAFRILDIAKVWPASRVERLPGGWGVLADDFVAAAYVAVLTCFVLLWRQLNG